MFFIKSSCYFEESPYICPREALEIGWNQSVFLFRECGCVPEASGSVKEICA